jgi:hypothetical protein
VTALRLTQQLGGKTVLGVLSGGNLDLRELGRNSNDQRLT